MKPEVNKKNCIRLSGPGQEGSLLNFRAFQSEEFLSQAVALLLLEGAMVPGPGRTTIRMALRLYLIAFGTVLV